MINEYNFDEFDKVSREQWMAKLNQDLGEEIVAKISKWDCERDLSMSAYYDRSDMNVNALKSSPKHSPWKYLQIIDTNNTNKDILEALMNGADGLVLDDDAVSEISNLLDNVAPEHCTVSLLSSQPGSYAKLLSWCNSKLDVNTSTDLLILDNSKSFSSDTSILKENFGLSLPNKHRVINLNGNLVHEQGGGAQLEIAYILAQGVLYINELLDQGYTLDDIADRLIISTAVGSNFFLELAKIRVIRKVVSRMFEAYGLTASNCPIHVRTSRLTQSVLDKNTNYLRCTTEAMSAVLGGADYLTISPLHDLQSKNRIARNISNLLKEESLLAKTIDPSSGSYYIETLSEELAKNAWQRFQLIEQNGGFSWAVANGYFEDEIQKDWEFQMSRIAAGKRKMVGVNDFGNQDEMIITDELSHDNLSYSKAFEEVRKSVENHAAEYGEDNRPIVYLLGIGSNAKMINARFTFVTNFFTWSGIIVRELKDGEEPRKGTAVVCCGADIDYTDEYLSNANEWGVPILAAGRINSEASSSISGWINIKSNRLKEVINVLAEMGVNHKTIEN